MPLNARAKGAAGEREFCKWLHNNFSNLPEEAKRNLDQVREGGTDVLMYPYCFEVKRRESLDLKSWWIQAKAAGKANGCIPIVAFRQNRKPWEFLIGIDFLVSEVYLGDVGFIRLDENVFKRWFAGALSNDRSIQP
jgi:hypothetical protein